MAGALQPLIAVGAAGPPPGPPAAPSNVVATQLSATQAALTWNDNSGNESLFRIWRRSRPAGTGSWSGWVERTTTAPDVTSWNDTTATEGFEYEWQVRAENAQGQSAWATSNALCINNTPGQPTISVAPTPGSEGVSLRITINLPSGTVNRYRIFETGVGEVGTVAVAGSQTTFDHGGHAMGTQHCYTLQAENNCGAVGPASAEQCGTTLIVLPGGALGFTVTPTGIDRVLVQWDLSTVTNTDRVLVEWDTDPLMGTPSSQVVLAPDEDLEITGLAIDTQIWVQVTPQNQAGSGSVSGPLPATTWKAVPGNFSGSQDKSQCPTYVVDYTWSVGSRTGTPLTLRYRDSSAPATWKTHINLPAGSEAYRWEGVPINILEAQLLFQGESGAASWSPDYDCLI